MVRKTNITYLIYYDFIHTKGNHAGMAHFAKYLNQYYGFRLIKHFPQEHYKGRHLGRLYSFILAIWLIIKLRKGDSVLFMEFLSGDWGYQSMISQILRRVGKKNRMDAIIHLAGGHLVELYKSESAILKRLGSINRIIVFGSSLKAYLNSIGSKNEIIETFHYVDDRFYTPSENSSTVSLRVLFIGNLKRDFSLLIDIIRATPSTVQFDICAGKSSNDWGLGTFSNVVVHDFLEEDKLLTLMQSCDVNLSVLIDTVGSNVITTSLAVGLVQIVSEVGSIRDYCSSDNSFFCHNIEDYISAINLLECDRSLLLSMKANAYNRSKRFRIRRSGDIFNEILSNI